MNDAAVWVPVPAMFYWGWLVPLIFRTIFGWRYHRDKVRLGNGIWFSLFFYSFLTMLAITILGSNIHWLIIISGTLFVLLILLIGLIFTLQAFLLLWNAWESYVGEYADLVLGTGHSDFAKNFTSFLKLSLQRTTI